MRKIQLSRDVVFDESKIGFSHLKKPSPVEEEIAVERGPILTENEDKGVADILEEQLMDLNSEHRDVEPNAIELPPVAEEDI